MLIKKILILAVIITLDSTIIFSQATPNAGFENWTHNTFPSYDTPDNWDNLNPATAILGVFTCIKATAAADIHTGSAAVKLITKSVFGQTANGIVTTGTINTTTQTIAGGIPYTLRPDSITGWYKYTSVSGDNGFAEILLLGSGGVPDTIGHARFVTPTTNVSAWTRFSLAINYYNSNPVVSSIWILSSSKDAVVHNVGSTAFFDDMDLVFVNPTNIAEQTEPEISVGPNPASDYLMIKNISSSKSLFVLSDEMGRRISEEKISNEIYFTDVHSLTQGMYFYSIVADEKKIVKTGKVIVSR